MEVFNRLQPKEIVAASKLKKLKRTVNWAIGVIMFLGLAFLALILFNLIYIPKLKANIIDLENQPQNNQTNNSSTLIAPLIKYSSCDITLSIPNSSVENFLNNSRCATDNQQKKFLASLIGNKSTTLLYNGSADGWTGNDFHSRCDNKGPTISLFKIKDGGCIGGYTSESWVTLTRELRQPLSAKESILFNLSKCRYFFCQRISPYSMYPQQHYGPSFYGGDGHDLTAIEPFNAEGQCESYGNKVGYLIPVYSGLNLLTDRHDGNFTITELEVWGFNN